MPPETKSAIALLIGGGMHQWMQTKLETEIEKLQLLLRDNMPQITERGTAIFSEWTKICQEKKTEILALITEGKVENKYLSLQNSSHWKTMCYRMFECKLDSEYVLLHLRTNQFVTFAESFYAKCSPTWQSVKKDKSNKEFSRLRQYVLSRLALALAKAEFVLSHFFKISCISSWSVQQCMKALARVWLGKQVCYGLPGHEKCNVQPHRLDGVLCLQRLKSF
jgi:hypothetical protein